MEKVRKILIISSETNLSDVLNFCFDGWGYEVAILDNQLADLTPIKKISPDVIIIDVHSARRSDLDICRLLKDDFITAFIPIITLINKRQLRSQLLSIKQGVDDYLIKPPDPLDLRVRVEMALKRSQYSHFASSLTGLPGARFIEETIKDKLAKNIAFSFCYLDLDNFKYFNDVYGYLKGDEVIMQTAYILYNTVKEFGNKNDFIGHIGGDDFVFITTLNKYKDICCNFVVEFDKIIPFHYNQNDRARGFVIARDRTHKIKKIPLISASIAIVNRKDNSEFKDIFQINERVAEIKHYLKGVEGSKFMTDRRNIASGEHANPQFSKSYTDYPDGYLPLGQILLKKKIINNEQLDEALKTHWKKGIVFGETLKELGFIKEEDLILALEVQKSGLQALEIRIK